MLDKYTGILFLMNPADVKAVCVWVDNISIVWKFLNLCLPLKEKEIYTKLNACSFFLSTSKLINCNCSEQQNFHIKSHSTYTFSGTSEHVAFTSSVALLFAQQ